MRDQRPMTPARKPRAVTRLALRMLVATLSLGPCVTAHADASVPAQKKPDGKPAKPDGVKPGTTGSVPNPPPLGGAPPPPQPIPGAMPPPQLKPPSKPKK